MAKRAQAVQPQQAQQPSKTGGDDLDDGLELDDGLLASSDDGGGSDDDDDDEGRELPPPRLDDEDAFETAGGSDDEDAAGAPGRTDPVAGVKRRAGAGDDDGTAAGETDQAADKKRRKKEKEKARKAKKMQSAPTAPPRNPSYLEPAELSSLLLASIRESSPSATPMEIQDLLPPVSTLLPALENAPADGSDEAEGSFAPVQRRIKHILENGPKVKPVTARIVILCLSGLRCADVVRGVRDVRGEGQVAKLFAKHMKYEEQVKYLAANKVSIAVGTPARISKLLVDGGLRINQHTHILLDIGHRDSKTRTLLTLPEIRDELWKSVFSGQAREKIIGGAAKIGAF